MFSNKYSANQKMTFRRFLSADYARDYIYVDEPYEEQIARAAAYIREADYVLIGVGAGMSAAAGAEYGGAFFQEHFAEFIERYGDNGYMRDMYSAGFYPFPNEESRWGLWCRLALLAGADLDVTPLHKTLLDALTDKTLFILSTNADGQFEKAGFPSDKVFATQGSYELIQCQRGCHDKTYNAVSIFHQMDQAQRNGKIPTYMVPKCPVCGGPMAMNLRSDDHFVEDENWHAAEARFGVFLTECIDKKTVLLELGVGFNTPTIIRLPFEKLLREHENLHLVRLNRSKAVIPASLADRAVAINADMAQSIEDIAKRLTDGRNDP